MNTSAQMIPLPPPRPRSMASISARRYEGKHLWWHDAVIDAMLAHPQWTKIDIARHLNCTPQMIYLLTNSDLFLARFEQRRQEFNRLHDQSVIMGLNKVAEQTLDIIGQVLAKKGDSVPLPQLVDLADKTLNRLGYGVKPAPSAPPVQVNVGGPSVSVSADAILEARMALRRNEQAKLTEGETQPYPAPEGRPQLANLTAGESAPVLPEPKTYFGTSFVELSPPTIDMEVESEPGGQRPPSSDPALFLGDFGADIADL